MKRLRYLFASVITLLVTACVSDTSPYVSLGLDDTYVVERMQPLVLTSGYEGEHYEWRLSYQIGEENVVDSLVATTRSYTFVGHIEGAYRLVFSLYGEGVVVYEITIIVRQEQIAYSPYITRVFEYRPAPGQFINEMPKYVEGDTEETMRAKVEECLAYNARSAISLGGYGGYVVVGFDHTIVNRPGQCDFKVLGNATYTANAQERLGGSCEPGIVMVSVDTNHNGKPDDEWYELAGSEYYKSGTLKNYEITYSRPDESKEPVLCVDPYIADSTYVRWVDNQGSMGYVARNVYHKQSYYPQWLDESTMTFAGTRLADNGVDASDNGSYYLLYAYDYGYADNHPNTSEKTHFDIDWAVDNEGNPMQLSGIDFVKIYTGVNQYNGWVGECSTEVMGVTDLHIEEE